MADKLKKRGFGSDKMSAEKKRMIHSMGGKASKGGGRKPKAKEE